MHGFGIIKIASAIDILRGDLEGVEEQASAARIDAGAEAGSRDLRDGDLDGCGILQQRQLDVIAVGGFRFGAGVEITVSRLAKSRRLAPFAKCAKDGAHSAMLR